VFTPKLKPAKTKTAKITKKRIKGKDNKLNK
jgi:hypothetical protein